MTRSGVFMTSFEQLNTDNFLSSRLGCLVTGTQFSLLLTFYHCVPKQYQNSPILSHFQVTHVLEETNWQDFRITSYIIMHTDLCLSKQWRKQ